jgi:N-ethylmaleimide reductase
MPVAFKQALRMIYPGTLIYAGKYTAERARQALEEGWADLIGFGRPFIANPDLPERLRSGAVLNSPDRATYFGGGAKGFTDYPALEEAAEA